MLHRLFRQTSASGDGHDTPAVAPVFVDPERSDAEVELEELLKHQAELAESAKAIAGGDLARDVVIGSDDDTLGIAFRDMLAGLRRLVGQVKDAAADVDTGAQASEDAIRSAGNSVDQLHGAIETIARGAEEQMAHVRAASGAIARVSSDVDQVAASAQDLAAASERARLTAEQGAEAVRGTVQGIREIADSTVKAAGRVRDLDALSQRIGAVVATIDAIAEQTNMLALNAAIEAARAGAHGRGFAVVAGEVRKLAERSQRETQQIGELVRTIQRETRDTATQILNDAESAQRQKERADRTATALAEIIGAVTDSARQVEAIAASARSAAQGTHALGDLMEPVHLVAETNAAATHQMAEQVAAAAEAMRNARSGTEALAGTAERLRNLISYFRLTGARRQAVNIPVSARASEWEGLRRARIVDLSATGARIDGLTAPEGIQLELTFKDDRGVAVHRSARVMRSALGETGPWVGIAFLETQSAWARAA